MTYQEFLRPRAASGTGRAASRLAADAAPHRTLGTPRRRHCQGKLLAGTCHPERRPACTSGPARRRSSTCTAGSTEVLCLTCGRSADRAATSATWRSATRASSRRRGRDRPDGDAVLETTDTFVVADCDGCGGIVKPDVVFFGESVRPDVVARAHRVDREAEAPTGRRLVADRLLRPPVRETGGAARDSDCVINRGPTKGDELVDVKWDCGTSEGLTELVDRLGA